MNCGDQESFLLKYNSKGDLLWLNIAMLIGGHIYTCLIILLSSGHFCPVKLLGMYMRGKRDQKAFKQFCQLFFAIKP
jgi:hypothetical protein